ncbi:hypothetical protein D0867_16428 [Hortaea werneckii]|uniref:4a-hydroxytetrahydrobiopterin dehydratase n=1 Tax=Hortaea werneckii TaxID=91943 RepID=A0A3M6WNA6_HORWE|nr:hypothetical protein D0867_16428 [Hortaea werneckii]RMX95201.1 hypothetical protein D0866_16521 [Hortaea werneckii]
MLTRADLSIADSTPDQETLVQEASQLVDNGGRWRLCRQGKGIERGFKFRTFKTTWVCLEPLLPFHPFFSPFSLDFLLVLLIFFRFGCGFFLIWLPFLPSFPPFFPLIGSGPPSPGAAVNL